MEVEATVDQTLSPAEVRFFCEQGVSDRMTIIRRAHPADRQRPASATLLTPARGAAARAALALALTRSTSSSATRSIQRYVRTPRIACGPLRRPMAA